MSIPKAVRLAQLLLGSVALYHLFLVLLTLTQTGLLRADVGASEHGMRAAAIEEVVRTSTTITMAVHVPLFLLTGILAIALSSGHPWALRPATVSQLFGIGFTTLSTPPFHALTPWIPVAIIIQASIIALLWAPSTSRRFFHTHLESRRSRRASTPATTK